MKPHTVKFTGVAAAALLTTTLALAAGGNPIAAQSPTANAVEAGPVPAANSRVGGSITRSEMLSRGRFWTDKHLAYSQKNSAKDPQGRKYRMDCSGFVSMAWHLGDSLTTGTLPNVSTKIRWSELKPGDILLKGNPAPWPSQHVVMFGGWANKAHTKMVILQEGGKKTGATEKTRDVADYAEFQPRRYNKVIEDAPKPKPPTPTTAKPKPPTPTTAKPKPPTPTNPPAPVNNQGDELMFYKASTGNYSYYTVDGQGAIGSPVKADTYSANWSSITNIEIDGDKQSELLFFNRASGVFAYYNVQANGTLGSKINSTPQSGMTLGTNWTTVTNVDVNGDGHDEVLFYDAATGAFAYYAVNAQGLLTNLLLSSSTAPMYSKGWTSITNVDLDGDGRDELLFYNGATGGYSYYAVNPNAQLGAVIYSSYQGAPTYSTGWTTITDVDLDADGQSELLFYNGTSGLYSYYNVNAQAQLGTPIRTSSAVGSPYSPGWTSIVNVNLDGQ